MIKIDNFVPICPISYFFTIIYKIKHEKVNILMTSLKQKKIK